MPGIGSRSDRTQRNARNTCRTGVREYWILNPKTRILHALRRAGDVWDEKTVTADEVYRTTLLPGLDVRPGDLLGPAEIS